MIAPNALNAEKVWRESLPAESCPLYQLNRAPVFGLNVGFEAVQIK